MLAPLLPCPPSPLLPCLPPSTMPLPLPQCDTRVPFCAPLLWRTTGLTPRATARLPRSMGPVRACSRALRIARSPIQHHAATKTLELAILSARHQCDPVLTVLISPLWPTSGYHALLSAHPEYGLRLCTIPAASMTLLEASHPLHPHIQPQCATTSYHIVVVANQQGWARYSDPTRLHGLALTIRQALQSGLPPGSSPPVLPPVNWHVRAIQDWCPLPGSPLRDAPARVRATSHPSRTGQWRPPVPVTDIEAVEALLTPYEPKRSLADIAFTDGSFTAPACEGASVWSGTHLHHPGHQYPASPVPYRLPGLQSRGAGSPAICRV